MSIREREEKRGEGKVTIVERDPTPDENARVAALGERLVALETAVARLQAEIAKLKQKP